MQKWFFVLKGWKPLPDESEPTPWTEIDQSLCEAYGYTPQQLDQMTLPEIRVLAAGKPDKKTDLLSALEHVMLLKKLTPDERLLAMRIALGRA